MFADKLGVFATLALAASAVLIPPSVQVGDLGDDRAMETMVINPFRRSVALECPGCAFAVKETDGLAWRADAGNAFLLEFQVGPREDTLDIDGVQLYPPSFGYFTQPFYVTQIDPNSSERLRLRVTGYHFHFDGAETVSDAGMELLPMTFQINNIESKPVNPPALTINLLKDAAGRLMIASFDTARAAQDTQAGQDENCDEWPLLCKWKGIVADRLDKLRKGGKGCHKRPQGPGPHHWNPMEHDGPAGKPPHRVRPGHPGRPGRPSPPHHHHHHGPHHTNQEGHRHHRVHMIIRRALFTILIPVFIGVFAGTLTYLIGMALGYVIAITVAKVRGKGYQRITLEEDAEDAEPRDEKAEFAELPAYDGPPVYEAAEEEEDQEKDSKE